VREGGEGVGFMIVHFLLYVDSHPSNVKEGVELQEQISSVEIVGET
jgi:hypothetical protein